MSRAMELIGVPLRPSSQILDFLSVVMAPYILTIAHLYPTGFQ
jgi:hypothetical protein